LARRKAVDAEKENDPTESETKFWVSRINQLKHGLEQTPSRAIPEAHYLNDAVWLHVAQQTKAIDLSTDAGMSEALSYLREITKQGMATIIGRALDAYTQANAGQLPAQVSQLKPYLNYLVDDADLQRLQMTKDQLDDAVLQRYHMTTTGNVGDLRPRDTVMVENAPVDEQFDTLYKIGPYCYSYKGIGANSGRSGEGHWDPPIPQTQSGENHPVSSEKF
jgi:hypothetical protein